MSNRDTTVRHNAENDTASRPRRGRPPRSPGLTQAAIVEAAFRIADAEGLHAVSIRSIAAELDARPMTLYTHIADKADLLALMGNEFAGLTLAPEPLPADWRAAVTEISRRSHAAYVAHPWVAELFAHRPALGDNVLKRAKQLGRAVEGLGLEPAAVWTMLGIVNDYVLGHALRVASTGSVQPLEDTVSPEDLTDVPDLTALSQTDAERSSNERFELGLQAVLNGVEQQFLTPPARQRKSTRAQKPRAARAAR